MRSALLIACVACGGAVTSSDASDASAVDEQIALVEGGLVLGACSFSSDVTLKDTPTAHLDDVKGTSQAKHDGSTFTLTCAGSGGAIAYALFFQAASYKLGPQTIGVDAQLNFNGRDVETNMGLCALELTTLQQGTFDCKDLYFKGGLYELKGTFTLVFQ